MNPMNLSAARNSKLRPLTFLSGFTDRDINVKRPPKCKLTTGHPDVNQMWYIMSQEQRLYDLSERLIRAITGWHYALTDTDVEELIREGAQVNRLHGTLLPLHCASMVGQEELLHVLLEHGAEVNLTDGYGRRPIHYAAERNPHCLQVLLANGAKVDSPDPNHDTPLHWAAFKNNHRCVRILLHHGANVDSVDNNGDTAICWAAMKGNLKTIKILLEYNATVDIENKDGKTPLSRVCTLIGSGLDSDDDSECLELLLRAVGHFDLRGDGGSLPAAVIEDNRLSDIIIPICLSPRSLKHLCRYYIRTGCGQRYLPNLICSLPLPRCLHRYILLET